MSESNNTQSFQMKFIDKLIVSLIFIASAACVVITFLIVDQKYDLLNKKRLAEFKEIPYNEKYKYLINDNIITFYQEADEVGQYTCITDCKISDFLSNQFIIDTDELIPIIDDNHTILYNINQDKENIVLDEVPKTSINNKYGVIKQNGKYGVINKHGSIVLQCLYDDVDINISHIVTLNQNILSVFDNNAEVIFSKAVDVIGEISISEKNDYLYITIIGNATKTLIFDTKSNQLVS